MLVPPKDALPGLAPIRTLLPSVNVTGADWQESSSFQRPSPDRVGPTLARLAGSVKRFESLRPTSRLSPPPRSAPPFLECSSSLSQIAPPSTSLLPDGSLAPVLSEELSCDVRCWR